MGSGTLQVPQKSGYDVEPCSEVQIGIPSFFMCPISLDLMRDPVILCTGMSYDRVSIERWLGSGHNTCPATNQVLADKLLIPNHTLHRLIQDWCVANRAFGTERIPVPSQPVDRQKVRQLLRGIAQGSQVHESLRKLRSLAEESHKNRKRIAETGAVLILANAMTSQGVSNRNCLEACEDALGTIALLALSEEEKTAILGGSRTLSTLCWILTSGSLDAKVNAAVVLHSISGADSGWKNTVGSIPRLIEGLVWLLKEDLHPRALHASLKCLLSLCMTRKNRLAAIEANAVTALVELLPNTEKGNTERAFALLEIYASCAEGREAISNHAMAIPMVVKSMVGVSDMAADHAVSTLWAVLTYASNRAVLSSALQAGAFNKLLMLLPSGCSQRAKHKARDILKQLNDVWVSHTCRPSGQPESAQICVL